MQTMLIIQAATLLVVILFLWTLALAPVSSETKWAYSLVALSGWGLNLLSVATGM